CKAECISVKDMEVDHSRCVACFNCLMVCEDSAIDFTVGNSHKSNPVLNETGTGRKSFIFASLAGIFSLAGIKKLRASEPGEEGPINKNPTTIPIEKNSYVSPPGSLSIDHFTSVCTACQLCVSQCPTGVLQPSFNEFGLSSIMQPQMDYNTNYCNYECVKCTDVCPTGAILPLGVEDKKILQLGKVQFIKENCVVYTENTACGSCSEHCPTQAVKMVPYKGSLTIPETDNSICVGCGACEYACPVVPYKAIYVDGNAIHLAAEKPKQEKLEEPSMEEDFPF
ncbi:MAG: 4Fe-4S dicluster domain-containing protein, partial [Bacteroidales bacterium]